MNYRKPLQMFWSSQHLIVIHAVTDNRSEAMLQKFLFCRLKKQNKV